MSCDILKKTPRGLPFTQGIIRKASYPEGLFRSKSISSKILTRVRYCLEKPGDMKGAISVDTQIAQAYGIDRETFESIIADMPKFTADEREIYLSKEFWR